MHVMYVYVTWSYIQRVVVAFVSSFPLLVVAAAAEEDPDDRHAVVEVQQPATTLELSSPLYLVVVLFSPLLAPMRQRKSK